MMVTVGEPQVVDFYNSLIFVDHEGKVIEEY